MMPIFSYYYYLLPTDKVVPTGRFSQTVHLEKESTRPSPISIEISARSAGTPATPDSAARCFPRLQ